MLPGMIEGREKACFAVTEPNTGLNTTQLKTRAVRNGDRYIVDGTKVWISTAQVADKILLLARTTPLEEVKRPTEGLSLFYTDLDRSRIKVHEIEKMGRKAVDFERAVHRGFRNSARRPHRRGRPGLRIHSARHESRAHPDRGRGGRARHAGARARRRLCARARRVQSSDRAESGDPASARQELDGAGSGLADDAFGGLAIRQRPAGRAPRQMPPNISPARPASRPASKRS